MEKIKMKSKNGVQANIEKIKEIFPHCVTETMIKGEVVLSIDYEALKNELNDSLDETKERYQMIWPGKRQSILLSNTVTTDTLRPSVGSSKDFFNTKNLYIEGNNFEVLKVLRETYLKKIGVIYIDPPYNTGRNILYKNDFSVDRETFGLINNDFDEEGNVLNVNRRSEGRFHTNWLNMMYPVLRVARDILSDEGIIVLAIDDNEYANLKKLCDEVFYEGNYVGTITCRSNPQGRGKKNIDPIHEYHIVYAKNIDMMPELKIKKNGFTGEEYWNFIRGGSNSRKFERPYRFYPMLVRNDAVEMITADEYKKIYNADSGFDEDFMKRLQTKYENEGYKVIWPISSTGEEKVWQRMFDRAQKEHKTYKYIGNQIKYPLNEYSTPKSMWYDDIHSNVQNGTGYLNKLFDGVDIFDYPKSVISVADLVSMVDAEYIMDFFAGSATTADSVMRLNAMDDGERKFIMVQLPENLDENIKMLSTDEAKNTLNAIQLCEKMNVPHNIAEVAKERIRRAGVIIKKEFGRDDLDVGFRNLKLDSSNMKDSFYKPSDIQQTTLLGTIDNIKDDRTDLDLVFQVMLNLGVVLSSNITEIVIDGKKCFDIDNGHIIACFEENISEFLVSELAKKKPNYLVFKDGSFATDSLAINTNQIVKTYSIGTKLRVL